MKASLESTWTYWGDSDDQVFAVSDEDQVGSLFASHKLAIMPILNEPTVQVIPDRGRQEPRSRRG